MLRSRRNIRPTLPSIPEDRKRAPPNKKELYKTEVCLLQGVWFNSRVVSSVTTGCEPNRANTALNVFTLTANLI
jgi:hypothetical protein